MPRFPSRREKLEVGQNSIVHPLHTLFYYLCQLFLVASWQVLPSITLPVPATANLPNLPISPSPRLPLSTPLLTANSSPPPPSSKCPADVETLTALMLKDLPSYANRVMGRTRRLTRTSEPPIYFVLAGRPEFEPLTLGPGQYTPPASTANIQPPQQVFFTTLERQYRGGKALNRQLYHWLFLTPTTDGWRLALMYSRIGSAPGRPPTPPMESSRGIVGQAVTLWLRDCRVGAIRRR